MPNSPVDPASLEGDDLVQWYRRSPWQIDQDRQALRRQQYNEFFHIQNDTLGGSDDPSGVVASQDDNSGQPQGKISIGSWVI